MEWMTEHGTMLNSAVTGQSYKQTGEQVLQDSRTRAEPGTENMNRNHVLNANKDRVEQTSRIQNRE